MHVFDPIKRSAVRPKPEGMSQFDWINQCGEDYAHKVRLLVQNLVDDFPQQNAEKLVDRLRSTDDSVHRGALLELVIHAWLTAQQHRIIAVEPPLSNSSKSPDFLVEASSGHRFYVEAVARDVEIDLHAEIKDKINDIDSPFYIDLWIEGSTQKTLSANLVAGQVESFLRSVELNCSYDLQAEKNFNFDGLKISVEIIARKSEKNRSAGTLGASSNGLKQVSLDGDLKKSLKRKASRYGELDFPYLVATTLDGFFLKPHDVTNALFGAEQLLVDPVTGACRSWRETNGIWYGPPGKWRNTGLTGVLLVKELGWTNLCSRIPELYLHPAPRHHLADEIDLAANRFVPKDGQLTRVDGGWSIGRTLGLPEDWPEPWYQA